MHLLVIWFKSIVSGAPDLRGWPYLYDSRLFLSWAVGILLYMCRAPGAVFHKKFVIKGCCFIEDFHLSLSVLIDEVILCWGYSGFSLRLLGSFVAGAVGFSLVNTQGNWRVAEGAEKKVTRCRRAE